MLTDCAACVGTSGVRAARAGDKAGARGDENHQTRWPSSERCQHNFLITHPTEPSDTFAKDCGDRTVSGSRVQVVKEGLDTAKALDEKATAAAAAAATTAAMPNGATAPSAGVVAAAAAASAHERTAPVATGATLTSNEQPAPGRQHNNWLMRLDSARA